MSATLEKVKRLEQYLTLGSTTIDPVIDLTVTKLLAREVGRINALKRRLVDQVRAFEHRYVLPSAEFYSLYEQGKMGDDTDFVEWAATIEMVKKIEEQLTGLEDPTPL